MLGRLLAGFLFVAALAVLPARAAETLPIGYVGLPDDPRHAEQRSYANLVQREAIDPFQGAELGLQEAKIFGRALDLAFELRRAEAEDAAGMTQAVRGLAEEGVRLVLLDAPGPVAAEVAAETQDLGVTLFNTSARDDALRGPACQPHLFHTAPSRAMLIDGLAQHLSALGWNSVILVTGEQPADAEWAEGFERSAARFGLDIVERRQFTESRNPRDRQANNPALLTGGVDYDVLVIADAEGEFGRHLPYNTQRPRPVAGAHGLVPSAWHWALERYGAPQLSQRFERAYGRRMRDPDYGAWMAVRLIAMGAANARSGEPDKIVEALSEQDLNFDAYKGLPASFRPWDRQLRQPVLLHTENAVAAIAPVEGFLHQTTELDTLGVDRAESACRAPAVADGGSP